MSIRSACAAVLALTVLACATGGGDRWVRADGSPTDPESLERDQMACFPNLPQTGPQSMGLEEARDCMHRKGWRRATQ